MINITTQDKSVYINGSKLVNKGAFTINVDSAGGYIQLLGFSAVKFDDVELDGQTYSNIQDLVAALDKVFRNGGGSGEGLQSIVPGENVTVDDSDPLNPVISATGGGAVSSVNGKTGPVVITAADVGALPDTYNPPAQSWNIITDKPTIIAAGTTQADARAAIAAQQANATVSQAEAEAGALTSVRNWTPQRVAQAIAALAPAGDFNALQNKPAFIAAGSSAIEAWTVIRDGALSASGGNNGGSARAAREDHTHASINGWPTNTTAALTIASGAATVNLSQRMNWYADITANLVLTLQNMVIRTPYTIDIVNTDTVQHTVSIDGVPYAGNQDFSIPPNGGAAIISIIQLTPTRPIYATIAIKQAP